MSVSSLSPLVVVARALHATRPESAAQCCVCGASEAADARCWLSCERCGVPFHDGCYFRAVATAWDRQGFAPDADPEKDPALRRLFICPGCRS